MGSTLTWQMGRELASLTKDGITYSYKYNYDRLRTYKSDGTNTYNYIWQDGKLISQTGAGNIIKFIYEGDKPTAINYNGTEYYYVTNLQGDVVAILDKNGNCVVEYTYDAWGKVLSVAGSMANTLGSHNPLRYRGYYYDRESGFYYLKSRYYDPNTGKFLNADSVSMLISGEKAYTYCGNNPVNFNDTNGNMYSHTYLYEYYDINSWSDTLLHMGLSPDQSTFFDLSYAITYGVGGNSYSINVSAILKESFDIINDYHFPIQTFSDMLFNALTMQGTQKCWNYSIGFSNFITNYQIETTQNIAPTSNWFGLGNMIYTQFHPLISGFRYGLVNERMGAAVSGTANEILGINLKANATGYVCESLAIYNAFIILGKRVLFSEIIFMCELSGGLMLGGFFGAKHTVVEDIAEKYKLDFAYTTNLNTLKSWVPSTGAVVMTYWNDKMDLSKGIHTVAAKYEKDEETGERKIIIYNYNKSEPIKEFSNFAEFFESTDHGLIGAYCLYDWS